jgi:uncharacterized membrane protein
MKVNSELRKEARAVLQGHWAVAAGITLVYVFLTGLTNSGDVHHHFCSSGCSSLSESAHGFFSLFSSAGASLITFAYIIFFLNIVIWGYQTCFLKMQRNEEPRFKHLFSGFQNYSNILTTLLIRDVYTCLWTLLFIIPGFVKAYSYGMTSYILLDNPEMKNNEAIEKSMAMMEGNKFKLFLLDLSFIWWFILCLFTLGIGLLWLIPYVGTAHAGFYEDLKLKTEA